MVMKAVVVRVISNESDDGAGHVTLTVIIGRVIVVMTMVRVAMVLRMTVVMVRVGWDGGWGWAWGLQPDNVSVPFAELSPGPL